MKLVVNGAMSRLTTGTRGSGASWSIRIPRRPAPGGAEQIVTGSGLA
jgi:hypothetical protein